MLGRHNRAAGFNADLGSKFLGSGKICIDGSRRANLKGDFAWHNSERRRVEACATPRFSASINPSGTDCQGSWMLGSVGTNGAAAALHLPLAVRDEALV